MCQVNNAPIPANPLSDFTENHYKELIMWYLNQLSLDMSLTRAHIYPVNKTRDGGADAEGRQRGRQDRCPARTTQLEPAPREGDRSRIPKRRVLRPEGLGPGQVRDAASGIEGRPDSDQGMCRFWFFATELLRGSEVVPSAWAGRPGTEEDRPAGSAQADGRGAGLCAGGSSGGTSSPRGLGRPHRGPLWCEGPPSQHRSGSSAEKKNVE